MRGAKISTNKSLQVVLSCVMKAYSVFFFFVFFYMLTLNINGCGIECFVGKSHGPTILMFR